MDIHKFLDDAGIAYEHYDHPAVFTCEEAQELLPDDIPGADTKNLFLRDKKGKRHILVTVGYDKSVDLKALSDLLDAKKLGFCSEERLMEHLGITPGSVSILALVNDADHNVECYIDEELWQADSFRVHPLINTASLVMSRDGIQQFAKATGHDLRVIKVPWYKEIEDLRLT